MLDRMRERAQRAVVAGMSADQAALLRGMVLGEDERIDASTRDDWRDSGLAHLLAVSGQNVMLLAALALPLLMAARAGLRTRLIVLAVLIALYVPLAGAGPSLQRAGVMGLAGIAAMAASRPASRWYALILAATATLLWNPRVWADPGWQLSFAAVAGILTIGVPLQRVLRRAVRELSPERPAAAGGSAPPRSRARSFVSASRFSTRSPTASPSPSPPRSPPRPCSPITSATSRLPACPPTCLPFPPSRRPCGSACSRWLSLSSRSAASRPMPPPVWARSRPCRSAISPRSPNASPTCPAGASRLR